MFIIVLQRVAYFRVGSGYDYLGYGSGKGIVLSLRPGTRVPSGNRRVVRLSKKKSENVPHIRIFFAFLCSKFGKKPLILVLIFSLQGRIFSELSEFKKLTHFCSRLYIFQVIATF